MRAVKCARCAMVDSQINSALNVIMHLQAETDREISLLQGRITGFMKAASIIREISKEIDAPTNSKIGG